MWYVLAAANALSGDSELIAGTQLRVPETAANKNDASTFKPYNPNEIVGSTAPGLPYIPPASSNNCAIVAMVVVAVVVTIFTAGVTAVAMSAAAQGIGFGAALTSMGTSLMSVGVSTLAGSAIGAGVGASVALAGSTVAATMAAAAAGGFVGSIASQVVGKALGAVDNFSWRQAVASGITSGLTAGIGSYMGSMSTLIKDSQWGKVAASAALTATSSYVGNSVAGVKGTSFSWKAIAASAVTSVIAGGINKAFGTVYDKINGINAVVGQTIGGMVSNVVNLHVRRQFGFNDKVDYGALAADAFGNAVGNAIVGGFNSGSTGNSDAKERSDWGLSRSQQEQLHQLPDAQQQIFFDQAAQGKAANEALAVAVTGIVSSQDNASRLIADNPVRSIVKPQILPNEDKIGQAVAVSDPDTIGSQKVLDRVRVTGVYNAEAQGYFIWNWTASSPGWSYTGQFVKADRPIQHSKPSLKLGSITQAWMSAPSRFDSMNTELSALLSNVEANSGRQNSPYESKASMRAITSYDKDLMAQSAQLAARLPTGNFEQDVASGMNNGALILANGTLGADAKGALAFGEAALVLNKQYGLARTVGAIGSVATIANLGIDWLGEGNTEDFRTDFAVQGTLIGISQAAEKSHNYLLWAAATSTNGLWNAYNYYKPDLTAAFDFMAPAQAPKGYFAPRYSIESQRAWLLQQGMNPELSTWTRPVTTDGRP